MEKVQLSDLNRLKLFSSLKDETLERLIEIGEKVNMKKGEHIFRDKDDNINIYIVLKGKVALYKLNESAQKRVVFILGEDKLVNEVILDNLTASISCEVFESGQILVFNKDCFINIMKDDFDLTIKVLNSLSTKIRRLYRQMKNTTPIKMEKRVAAKLWKLSKDYGKQVEEGVLIDLHISITYLADMFGAPRETISRALKVLQENNLVKLKNKKIIVRDRKSLANYFKGI